MSKEDIEYLITANIEWICSTVIYLLDNRTCSTLKKESMTLETIAVEGKVAVEDIMKAIE